MSKARPWCEPEPLVCSVCGGRNVQIRAWIDPNTDDYIGDCEDDDAWCDDCGEHVRLCRESGKEVRDEKA